MPARLRQGEADDAERAAAGTQRHEHERRGVQRAGAEVLGVARTRGEPLVGDLAHEGGVTALDHGGEGAFVAGLDDERRRLGETWLDGWIGVSRAETAQAPLGVEDIDENVIGEIGDGHSRHALERGVVIERPGQDATRLREEGGAAASLLGLRARHLGS